MEFLGGIISRYGVPQQSFWRTKSCHSTTFDVCCSTRLFEDFLNYNMEADSSECNIKVVCRFRPQSRSEVNSGGLVMTKYPAKSNDTTVFGVRLPHIALLSIKSVTFILTWRSFLLSFFTESGIYFWSCFPTGIYSRRSLYAFSKTDCKR